MEIFAVGDFIVAVHSDYDGPYRVEVAALTGDRQLTVFQAEPRGFANEGSLIDHLATKSCVNLDASGMHPGIIISI